MRATYSFVLFVDIVVVLPLQLHATFDWIRSGVLYKIIKYSAYIEIHMQHTGNSASELFASNKNNKWQQTSSTWGVTTTTVGDGSAEEAAETKKTATEQEIMWEKSIDGVIPPKNIV